MQKVSIIGLDLAKRVFQAHGVALMAAYPSERSCRVKDFSPS